MRTKTLLAIAALSAAGVATSMAQVFSVNAVGYVVKTVPPNGLALIANPLQTTENKISDLFRGAPAGTQVYKFNPVTGRFDTATMDQFEPVFDPVEAGNLTVSPGEGVFVRNPTAQPLSFTFVGEVMQGNLVNPLPMGLSIKSSMVPQAGTAAELGLQGQPGDQVHQFRTDTQRYHSSTFDQFEPIWDPALLPLEVGEAFFLNKQAAGTWTRNFTIPQ